MADGVGLKAVVSPELPKSLGSGLAGAKENEPVEGTL